MKMKVMSGVAILIATMASSVCAQDQLALVSPANPKNGDEVVVLYNPLAKSASLEDVKEMTAEVLVARGSGELPQLLEIPMKKNGSSWKGVFKLADEKARMILVRFSSGDKIDDNGEKSWESMIYASNGNPVEGALLLHASLMRSGSYIDFKLNKDPEAAKRELARERELYPENYAAAFMQWSSMLRENPNEETKKKIQKELDALFAKTGTRDDLVAQFASTYQQVGMKEKADEIRTAAVAANPKGKVAENVRINEVYAEKDASRRATMMEKFLADFPQHGTAKENYDATMISFYVAANKYEEALAVLDRMPKKSGDLYNNLAWGLIEKGEQLEKAVAWAKKGVDLLRRPDPSTKPGYLSTRQWKKSNEMGLGMILDTYAFGLYQWGKTLEAEAAYEEAFKLTAGGQADVNQRLIECYIKNGKFDKAMSTAAECIAKGKSNDKIVESYKTAYVKAKGSAGGFEDALSKARETAKGDLHKELVKTRVNKPAIEFALKDLTGKVVKLSDLRGKVVVVDFWATWCGPCKSSFPYLQQVYNKYTNNPKVVILALDTWERVAGKEREDLVKKFMADNKYTFPVLYDEGFVEKYGVEGIPTKFVIDKKGMIQFKTIGFTGEKMVDELTMQLEMLLDDTFYSSRP